MRRSLPIFHLVSKMISMNDKMKQILKQKKESERKADTKLIAEKIIRKTRSINNCVIYDEKGNLDEKSINFNRILKFVKDRTGYEISCNELRFSQNDIPSDQILYFVETIDFLLSSRYKGRGFGIIVSLQDEEIELRFHTFRYNEGLWLASDLNKYDIPILYSVC